MSNVNISVATFHRKYTKYTLNIPLFFMWLMVFFTSVTNNLTKATLSEKYVKKSVQL